MAVTSFAFLNTNTHKDVDADETGELLVAGAATAFSAKIDNTANGVACFFKVYDKATAPTVGTDVPVFVIRVPASASFEHTFNMALGHKFTLGIGVACTTGAIHTDQQGPTNAVLATVLTS